MLVVRLILFSALLYNIEATISGHSWFYKSSGGSTEDKTGDTNYDSVWDTNYNGTRINNTTTTDYDTPVVAVDRTTTNITYARNETPGKRFYLTSPVARRGDTTEHTTHHHRKIKWPARHTSTTTMRPNVGITTSSSTSPEPSSGSNDYNDWINNWQARRASKSTTWPYVGTTTSSSTSPEPSSGSNYYTDYITKWHARRASTSTMWPGVRTTESSRTSPDPSNGPTTYIDWIKNWQESFTSTTTMWPDVRTTASSSTSPKPSSGPKYYTDWITDWLSKLTSTTTTRPYYETISTPPPKPALVQNVTISPIMLANPENPINISINSSITTNEAQSYSAISGFLKKLAGTVLLSAGITPNSNFSHLAVANGNGNIFFYINN